MIHHLATPIDMKTPLGYGLCILMWEWPSAVFYGVAQSDTGEVWWWQNHHIRIGENISEGRPALSEIKLSKAMEKALAPHRKRYPGGHA